MEPQLTIRRADSPFVQAVTRWVIGDADRSTAIPDGSWDLVVLKQAGEMNILLTGQTTQAVPLAFAPGDEILTIAFKASAFLSFIPSDAMLDRGILLPKTRDRFQLAADLFEIPTFENAEDFVRTLVKKGHLCQDEIVEAMLLGHPQAYSPRSIQRRFLRATGMTHKTFAQIQRARHAATLLQQGKPAVEVAYEAQYADQAHLARSVKRFLGYTPTEIAHSKDL